MAQYADTYSYDLGVASDYYEDVAKENVAKEKAYYAPAQQSVYADNGGYEQPEKSTFNAATDSSYDATSTYEAGAASSASNYGDNEGYEKPQKTNYNAATDASYADLVPYDAGAAGGYQTPYGISCWNCHADSFELCQESGYLQTCQANEVIF